MAMASPAEETTQNVGSNGDGAPDDDKLGTQSTIETVGPCKRRIKAEVPVAKVEDELDRNYKELVGTVQIPGFRRGHVPRRLLESRYGKEIESDVKETLVELSFQEVVKERELKVLGRPRFEQVTLAKGDPLRYEVEIEIQPEFQLGEYSGIEVEEPPLPTTVDQELEDQLSQICKESAHPDAIDPAHAEGADFITGGYTLWRGDLRLHTETDVHFVAGTDRIQGIEVPDLLAKVKARAPGATISVEVKLPDHYAQEALRGQDVRLELSIEAARRMTSHPLNDELAKHFGLENVDQLRSKVRDQIEHRHKHEQAEAVELKIIGKIADGLEFDMPEGLLQDQLAMSRMRVEMQLARAGLSRERIQEELQKVDEKKVGEELRKDFKRFFILDKIGEAEKIFATEDETEARLAVLARAYNREPDELRSEMESNGRVEALRMELRNEKVRKFLREKAKLTPAASGGATS